MDDLFGINTVLDSLRFALQKRLNRFGLLIFSMSILNFSVFAQVSNDTVICRGETIILETHSDYEFYSWVSTPSTIWSLGSRSAVRPLSDQEFSVIGRRRLDEELIVDGDFQASSPMFNSELLISLDQNFGSGTVSVVSNSGEANGDHDACPDLTGIVTDSFLAIHAVRGQAPRIWCQDVAVEEGAIYGFGATVATLKSEHIGSFAFLIDGVQIGRPAPPEYVTCTWRGYLRDYEATRTGFVQACISVESPATGAAIVAVDQITFKPYDAPFFDTFQVIVNEAPDTSTLEISICEGSQYEYEGIRYDAGRTHEIVYPHQSPCDSILLLTITEVSSFYSEIIEEYCSGHIIDLDNGEFVTLTKDTSFSTVYSSTYGCDSIVLRSYRVLSSQDIELSFDRGMCSSNELRAVANLPGWPLAQLQWSDGTYGSQSEGLEFESNFSITATLPDRCSVTRPFNTPSPILAPLVRVVKAPTCFETSDATIKINFLNSSSNTQSLHLNNREGLLRELPIQSSEIILDKLKAGDYRLILKDSSCEVETLFKLLPAQAQALFLEGDTMLLQGQSTSLNLDGLVQFDDKEITWFGPSFPQKISEGPITGSNQNIIIPRSGRHTIHIQLDSFCTQEFAFNLTIKDEYLSIFPSAFSPNGDAVNDIFEVADHPYIESVSSLKIFNRWGELIFSGSEDKSWHGIIHESGVYVYESLVLFSNGDSKIYTGDVILLR